MDRPRNAVVAGGKLFVAEYGNRRVAIYNAVPTSGPGTIDVVVGQADKTSKNLACTQSGVNRADSVAATTDKLVVADGNNNRVLIWTSIPTSDGQPADLVLGQPNFTSCAPDRGGLADATTLEGPTGVWTDGTKLVVTDTDNNRVLIWTSFPTSNGQAADLVLGQPNFTSTAANQGGAPSAATLYAPHYGPYSDGTQLFVADTGNHRVLIWNSFPTSMDQAADNVLGQADFVSSLEATTAVG